MKIKFKGHQVIDREVELSNQELKTIFEVMKQTLIDKVEFGTFDGYSYYAPDVERIIQLCKAHNVNVSHKKDRLTFFAKIVENLECPYD